MNRHTLLVASEREAGRFPDAIPLASSPYLDPEDLLDALRRAGVKQVGASSAALADERVTRTLEVLRNGGVTIRHGRGVYEKRYRRVDLDGLHPAFGVFDVRRGPVSRFLRRVVDLVVGAFGLVFCTVFVLPLLWLAVRLDDKGPLFYSQVRVGLSGRLFTIWKIRTMRVDAEAAGPQYASVRDPRITRLGHVLRRTRLDELPQLWNLVRGDMTLIGPRPERPEFEEGLQRTVPAFRTRHASKPGLTGWAAVRLGYADGVAPRWEAHAYDLYYLAHRSIWLDLEILARTVLVVLGRGGR
ncbi:MAG: exopolysaccharide biosynthesis polyprenyl glycosylphosphotransferase [Frankiales bacterium]|nr:exopolysaccharide biosynthesis polyprenyl glycosylphosphotransferase [Frankiales bacterium]MCW2587209.1 exopolysaccharide biosynthesis polyprenyl glycosylphosphotransferase [Frankiales bacterium]